MVDDEEVAGGNGLVSLDVRVAEAVEEVVESLVGGLRALTSHGGQCLVEECGVGAAIIEFEIAVEREAAGEGDERFTVDFCDEGSVADGVTVFDGDCGVLSFAAVA